MDINTAIKRIIRTGKVEYGNKKAVNLILNNKAKLVIVSSNCPRDILQDIEHYSKLTNTPVFKYNGTSLELGEVCGKPFVIANLTVIDFGDVNLTDITKGK